MPERRPEFCADASLQNAEPLAATASRVDHWILVEYRGLWGHDAVEASGLSDEVKARLRAQRDARPNTKLLFVRRPHRRGHPALAVIWGSSPERGGTLCHAELDGYDDLLGLDLTSPGGEQLDHPILIVCTHGKHDRCCARHGRPLYKALEEQADEGWVWQSSHLGGDRFAGNVVFLPEGLYFGRVAAGDAWPVLDDYLAGRIDARPLPRPVGVHVPGAGGRAGRAPDDRPARHRRPRAGRARRRARPVPSGTTGSSTSASPTSRVS